MAAAGESAKVGSSGLGIYFSLNRESKFQNTNIFSHLFSTFKQKPVQQRGNTYKLGQK